MNSELVTIEAIAAPTRNAIVGGPFGSDLVSKDYAPTGVPVIRGQNMGSKWVGGEFAFVSEEKANELESNKARPGDLVFTQRGTLGQVAIVPSAPYPEYIVSQSQMKLTPDLAKADINYLYYVFCSSEQKEYIRNAAIQTGVPHTNLGILKKTPIVLPPLSVQREIAGVLGCLDDRISHLRETNTTLEAIAQALFKSWFVDFEPVRAKQEGRPTEGVDDTTAALFPGELVESELGLVPKGWTVQRLADITERITKGTTPTTLKRPFVEAGINFVKAESMSNDGSFLPKKFAFIDEETHELLKRSQLATGDVLISIAGTIGRTAIVTSDVLPANTNQAVALVRPRQDVFPSGLVWRFLSSIESKRTMSTRVVQAVQANLSLGTLSGMKLVVPPPGTVDVLYQSVFAPIDVAKNINIQRIHTLSNLRDTLLSRLIPGQLRSPDAKALVA
ncbi:hypothetical protein LMG28614_04188 [Paraburkholderia ultramafica]|uniref:Type I restriction modification DNA specificity domain-containing protein n=1 Tax=Paraburkholderia ultramafica TaxID=1544867 RepID=A0A6S7BCF5_9BURK|nr:restriction endonuclease subunit S [Paraburkholderia ultramafica]CAB3795501.1 hypothetical protein LMG28614_04188 [Paraburkholderia ultramafica]